jgi:hypothetical protein
MVAKFTIEFDCADPNRLAHFWAEALGDQVERSPSGFETWKVFWKSKGVPDEEAGKGDDLLSDPDGPGPRIWFPKVEEGKTMKNRLHLDLNVSGGYDGSMETRKERVHAAAERLVALGATRAGVLEEAGVDHFAVAMQDPEGNEFDLN